MHQFYEGGTTVKRGQLGFYPPGLHNLYMATSSSSPLRPKNAQLRFLVEKAARFHVFDAATSRLYIGNFPGSNRRTQASFNESRVIAERFERDATTFIVGLQDAGLFKDPTVRLTQKLVEAVFEADAKHRKAHPPENPHRDWGPRTQAEVFPLAAHAVAKALVIAAIPGVTLQEIKAIDADRETALVRSLDRPTHSYADWHGTQEILDLAVGHDTATPQAILDLVQRLASGTFGSARDGLA